MSRITAGVSLLLASSIACNSPDRHPTTPDVEAAFAGNVDVSQEIAAAASRADGSWAAGRVEIRNAIPQNIAVQKYSFTARAEGEFPRARGHVELHLENLQGVVGVLHAEVTCLSVLGTQAWIGGRVRSYTFGGQDFTGTRHIIFRVRDVGEGDVPEEATLININRPPGAEITYCATRATDIPPTYPTENGNIQVVGG